MSMLTEPSHPHLPAPIHWKPLRGLPFLSVREHQSCYRPQDHSFGSHTARLFRSSSNNISRWCNRLNLLILSWSSRRTSKSPFSAAASSSRDNCQSQSFCLSYDGLNAHHAALHVEGSRYDRCGIMRITNTILCLAVRGAAAWWLRGVSLLEPITDHDNRLRNFSNLPTTRAFGVPLVHPNNSARST